MITGGNEAVFILLRQILLLYILIYRLFHSFHCTQCGCVPLFNLSSLVCFCNISTSPLYCVNHPLTHGMCCIHFPCIVINFSWYSTLRVDCNLSEKYNIWLKASWFILVFPLMRAQKCFSLSAFLLKLLESTVLPKITSHTGLSVLSFGAHTIIFYQRAVRDCSQYCIIYKSFWIFVNLNENF